MSKLIEVEGIGEAFAKKLVACGIKSTNGLLKDGASAKGRKHIAEKTGISETIILEWVNHIDLFRLRGVGGEYADLLEEAGVDTVVELAQRNPDNLHQKLQAINAERKLVRKLPTVFQVRNWIKQAAELPKVVSY